jgi:hypothetical protein
MKEFVVRGIEEISPDTLHGIEEVSPDTLH